MTETKEGELYVGSDVELKNTRRCFICRAEYAHIRNPFTGAVMHTCTNKECHQHLWPKGWEKADPSKYQVGNTKERLSHSTAKTHGERKKYEYKDA